MIGVQYGLLLTQACTLTVEQMDLATRVGHMRQRQNERAGRRDAYGCTQGAKAHTQGAQAELAFAVMAGLPLHQWTAYTTGSLAALPGDVAGYQVRSTTYRTGKLLIHPHDPDDAPVALIINAAPRFTTPGWLPAMAIGKQDQWWPGPNRARPCFAIPQSALLRWYDQ